MNPKVPPLYQGPLGGVSCTFDGILKRKYARMLFVRSSEEHHGDIWEPRGTLSPLVTNYPRPAQARRGRQLDGGMV